MTTLIILSIVLVLVVFAVVGLVVYRCKKKYFSVRKDEPLTEFQLSAIEGNRETLLECIDTSQLLDLLEKNGVFDKAQLDAISSKSTSREKNEALLEILKNGNLLSYWQTISCLRQSNQSYAAERLEPQENHAICIRRLHNRLLSSLTKIPEIVAEMYQKEKISDSELERLQSCQDTPVRASKELLSLLISSSVEVYESFLESLRVTKQEHIYLSLTLTSAEFETDLNTISEHSILIRRNFSLLIESFDFENNILERLYEKEVLSQREYEQISNMQDRFRKSEALLLLIQRKSDDDFTVFKEALQNSNLRRILEELHICLPEKQSQPTMALAKDKHEKEPIPRGRDNGASEQMGCILIKSLSRAEDSSVEILIKHDRSANRLLTKCFAFHDDVKNEIFLKKTTIQKQMEKSKSNEQMRFDEKQEDMEQQLAESRMQREAQIYAFQNARMDMKKEKDLYEKSRMSWEKEREELIRSLNMSQMDLKKEKDSYEKSRMNWEKEREELIRSLHMSQMDLKKEKDSYQKSKMESEEENGKLVRTYHI